jgi:hypothetical protein
MFNNYSNNHLTPNKLLKVILFFYSGCLLSANLSAGLSTAFYGALTDCYFFRFESSSQIFAKLVGFPVVVAPVPGFNCFCIVGTLFF